MRSGANDSEGSRMNAQHFELRLLILVRESALMMRVTKKRHICRRVEKSFERLRRREHVFVFILKRAVHQEQFRPSRAGPTVAPKSISNCRQKVATRVQSTAAFATGLKSSVSIKIARGLVVISAYRARAEFANLAGHFVGIGAISDHIAEARDMIPAILRRIESGVKCCCVGVNIAKNEDPHAWCPKSAPEYKGTCKSMHGGKTCDSKITTTRRCEPGKRFPQVLISMSISRIQIRGHKTSHCAAIEHSLMTNTQHFYADSMQKFFESHETNRMGCIRLYECSRNAGLLLVSQRFLQEKPRGGSRGAVTRILSGR